MVEATMVSLTLSSNGYTCMLRLDTFLAPKDTHQITTDMNQQKGGDSAQTHTHTQICVNDVFVMVKPGIGLEFSL